MVMYLNADRIYEDLFKKIETINNRCMDYKKLERNLI